MILRPAAARTLVVATAIGCGPAHEREPEHARPAAQTSADATQDARGSGESTALAGAGLIASYETSALARLAGALPRPTANDSPLADAFAGVIDRFAGEPTDPLARIGLSPDSRIELSVRALDERRAAVRKRIADLASLAPSRRTAADLLELHEQASSLGVHLRATLPSEDPERLSRALELVAAAKPEDPWRGVCDSLGNPRSCGGRERLLLWTRPHPRGLRVDALYLFHAPPVGSSRTWLADAATRADGFSERPTASSTAAIELRLDADGTKSVLHTELTADAAMSLVRGELDEHALLDREQAFDDLLATERLFGGIEMRGSVGAGSDPIVEFEISWTPLAGAAVHMSSWAEPSPLILPGPEFESLCRQAIACIRIDGISRVPRFAPLATGPYADATTIQRVLTQAGDRGWLLVELATWPNLIGTLGSAALANEGLIGRAAGSLTHDSAGVGAALIELGATPGEETWVAWLRARTNLIELALPLASLAGVDFVDAVVAGMAVRAGDWTSDAGRRVRIVTVEQDSEGWLIAADDDPRASWLLELAREPGERAGFQLQMRELGRIGARERVAYTEDPPVQAWLQTRELEVEGHFDRERGALVTVVLRPRLLQDP